MNVGILSSIATALGGLAIGASAASAAITPVTSDGGGATALAQSMIGDPGILTGASFDAVPPLGTPHGTADAPLSLLPSDGTSFGILTSGDVALADDPNSSGGSGLNIEGPNVRGDTDYDVTVLKLQLEAPAGTNCLSFDFAFYSDEYPSGSGRRSTTRSSPGSTARPGRRRARRSPRPTTSPSTSSATSSASTARARRR